MRSNIYIRLLLVDTWRWCYKLALIWNNNDNGSDSGSGFCSDDSGGGFCTDDSGSAFCSDDSGSSDEDDNDDDDDDEDDHDYAKINALYKE